MVFPPDEVMRDVDFVFDIEKNGSGGRATKAVDGMEGNSPSPTSFSTGRCLQKAFSHRYYESHFESCALLTCPVETSVATTASTQSR